MNICDPQSWTLSQFIKFYVTHGRQDIAVSAAVVVYKCTPEVAELELRAALTSQCEEVAA